jgi:hypothetical protein
LFRGKNKKIHYTQALKKQIWTITAVIAGVIAYPMILGGFKTDMDLYLWILLTVIAAYLVLLLLKKHSGEALCPHCNADLFEVIQTSQGVKLDFNFCPKCGEEVEV